LAGINRVHIYYTLAIQSRN